MVKLKSIICQFALLLIRFVISTIQLYLVIRPIVLDVSSMLNQVFVSSGLRTHETCCRVVHLVLLWFLGGYLGTWFVDCILWWPHNTEKENLKFISFTNQVHLSLREKKTIHIYNLTQNKLSKKIQPYKDYCYSKLLVLFLCVSCNFFCCIYANMLDCNRL